MGLKLLVFAFTPLHESYCVSVNPGFEDAAINMRVAGPLGEGGKARDPLGGLHCCQTQRGVVLVVTCFVLVLVLRLARETSRRYGVRNQQMVEFDLQKK